MNWCTKYVSSSPFVIAVGTLISSMAILFLIVWYVSALILIDLIIWTVVFDYSKELLIVSSIICCYFFGVVKLKMNFIFWRNLLLTRWNLCSITFTQNYDERSSNVIHRKMRYFSCHVLYYAPLFGAVLTP